MLTITFNGPDSNFFDTNLTGTGDDGHTLLENTSTRIVAQHPINGSLTTLTGFGFSFDAQGNPTGGTVTGVVFEQSGATVASFTGMSWSLVDFVAAIDGAEGDDLTALNTILSQQDIVIDASSSNGFSMWDFQVNPTSDVTIIGSDSNDALKGGAGDDVINPGNNGGFDDLIGTTGNDSYILSDLDETLGGGYVGIGYWDLNAGITVNLDSTTNSLTINKGANGTDTFTDVINPLTSFTTAGFGISGTYQDDTFNLTTSDNTFLQVKGFAGDDVFNVTSGQTVRLDYANSDSAGVNINLSGGGILDDGYGDQDTLNIFGGDGRVEWRLSDMADTFVGSDGNDRVILRRGNDTADGGDGYDTLRYDRSQVEAIDVDLAAGTITGIWRGDAFTHTVANFEEIRGSRNDHDTMTGDGNNNTFDGRGGDDTLYGAGGDDRLFGGDGEDDLYGGDGNDKLYGGDEFGPGDGDDLYGGAGVDDLYGGEGDDILDTGDNTWYDNVHGSRGDDEIVFTNGVNGYHEVRYHDLNAGVTFNVNIGSNSGTVDKGANGTDLITDVATPALSTSGFGGLGLLGSSHNDTFNVTQVNGGWMKVNGGAGTDSYNFTLSGGTIRFEFKFATNYDLTPGGVNIDLSTGTIHDDGFGNMETISLSGSGGRLEIRATDNDDTIIGSNRDERFILEGGTDSLDGGDGYDILRYDRNEAGNIKANLLSGRASGQWDGSGFNHTFTGLEALISGSGNDTLTGDDGNNYLEAKGGDDTLRGGNGRDDMIGGDGNDIIEGGQGNDIGDGGDGIDQLFGGAGNDDLAGDGGNDTLEGGTGGDILYGDAGDDDISGNAGTDDLFGGDDNDILRGAGGDDTLTGDGGSDRLLGGGNKDVLYGGAGDDTLEGAATQDTLYGGDDNDILKGGNGNDTMYGGDGDDVMTGGKGNDVFVGGAGDDTMTGGVFRDDFIFADGFGNDVITDFNANSPGEDIDLSGVTGITDFTDLVNNHMAQVGGDVVITDGADTITLLGVDLGKLDVEDFLF